MARVEGDLFEVMTIENGVDQLSCYSTSFCESATFAAKLVSFIT